MVDDQVDEIADKLADAAEVFLARRDRLIAKLQKEKSIYDAVVLETEDWAVRAGLIDDENWTDGAGEPFLPVAKLEILTGPVADIATLFRERVATLRESRKKGWS